MEEKRLKIDVEIHVVGDGRTYINFWNYKNGDDVVAQLVGEKLIIDEHTEITLKEFVERVKSKFNEQ